MSDYKNRLYTLYDKYDLLEDKDEQKERLKKEILNIVASVKEPDYKDYHIAGLAIYFSVQKNDADLQAALDYFNKAYQINPEYTIAILYSAHCYHDSGDYKSALNEYLKVDREQIKIDFSLWRYVKLLEQIGFCYFKTGKVNEARSYFEKVLWHYQNTKLDDLVDAVELFQCLDDKDPISKKIKAIEFEYYHS